MIQNKSVVRFMSVPQNESLSNNGEAMESFVSNSQNYDEKSKQKRQPMMNSLPSFNNGRLSKSNIKAMKVYAADKYMMTGRSDQIERKSKMSFLIGHPFLTKLPNEGPSLEMRNL